ncbi:S9 family peptidase [Idiomarina xiamenensis]|uniref:Acylaminoacyl peptidase n=1 Tax=Idiomarina xiamenensis 10-D-4 TaxID=740709 RepID=K2K4J3_9GAMM|nr:S9 family peptidase [Idiomarina xiamenensis]EKE81517.1 acylaminoacyl peptidase [Idiomarina xiamenensis 10-D-4]
MQTKATPQRLRKWLAAMALGLAASSLLSTAQARDISLQETVSVNYVQAIASSADGQWTAVIKNQPRQPYVDDDGSDYSELYLVNRDGQEKAFISGAVNVSQVQFDAAGNWLYFLTKRGADKQRQLYRIAVNGGEAQRVFQHDASIASYALSNDGQYVAFRATAAADDNAKTLAKKGFKAEVYEEDNRFTELYLLSLSGDQPPTSADVKTLVSDRQVLSVAFHPNGQALLIRTAPTALIDDNYMSSRYELISLTGEQQKTYASDGKLGAAAFSPDGRYLAMISAADYNDPAAGRLRVYDSRSDDMRDVLPDYQGQVVDFAWRASDELVWLGHRGTESEVQALTLTFLENRTLVPAGEAIFTDLEVSANGAVINLIGHRAEHPREAFALVSGQLKRLTDSNPWLSDIDMPQQASIEYKARDGQSIQGIVVYPTDYQQGQRYPLIMVVHGGPESHYSNGWLDSYSSPVKYAAQRGYALFFPNYRGSTGRGVAFSKLGQNDYAGKEFDDLVDGKDYLVQEGLVDDKRVGITGGSYGGYASAWGATALTEHFAASVMFVGISDNLSKFGTTDIAKEMHAVHARSYPWDKWQWYLERSPIYHTADTQTPLLILHGKEDTRVHPSQSMELYRYMKTRGQVPVRLVLYPGEGHGNRKVAAQLDYSMRLMRWMDNFLVQQAKDKPPHELPHAEQL